MTRGRFITFEGGEGAGKSTQVALLAEDLRGAGIETLVTREPGGAPSAEDIRSLLVRGHVERWTPLTEALLHYAARHEHLTATILPAVDAGQWVVCDRFADSTMAYQGFGHGLDRELITRLYGLVVGTFAPDLTIVLDLPVEAGLARAGGRGGGEDRYERMDRAFHDRLRQGFLAIARAEPERCAVIDASGDIAGIRDAVRDTVRQRLGVAVQ